MARTVCTYIKNSMLQISIEDQIHQKHLSHLLLVFSSSFFFDESLTKRESSSVRLLFLEIVINTDKSGTLKIFMQLYSPGECFHIYPILPVCGLIVMHLYDSGRSG